MRAVLPSVSATPPSSGRRVPTMPLSSVDFPAPFGPTMAVRLPGGDLAVEMVHGRVAAVAERQVLEADGSPRAHAGLPFVTAKTISQSAPRSRHAPRTR